MVTQDNMNVIVQEKASPVAQRTGLNKSRKISKKQLQAQFHLPASEAAKALGISVSKLYKSCKKHNIKGWPTRKQKTVVTKFFNYVVESGTLVQSKGEVISPKDVPTTTGLQSSFERLSSCSRLMNPPATVSPISNERSACTNSIVQSSSFYSQRQVAPLEQNWTDHFRNNSFAQPPLSNNCYPQQYYPNQNGYAQQGYMCQLQMPKPQCIIPQEPQYYCPPVQQTQTHYNSYEEPEEVRLPSFGELLESVCAYELSHPKVPKPDLLSEFDCLVLHDSRSIQF